jgi:hypothetical protein
VIAAMTLPLSRRRSRKSSGSPAKRPPKFAGVQAPEISVRVRGGNFGGFHNVTGRIQLRRAKYRYLVWYEDGRKREFYLGQVKFVPPPGSAGGDQVRRPAAPRVPARAGVRKRKT